MLIRAGSTSIGPRRNQREEESREVTASVARTGSCPSGPVRQWHPTRATTVACFRSPQRFSSIGPCASCVRAWALEAPHPQWEPTEPWSENVSSYAIDDGERLLPSIRSPCRASLWTSRPAARRRSCLPRRGMSATRRAWSSGSTCRCSRLLPDTAQFLMDTYGLTAEQAGDGSPDVVWLLREKKGEARPYSSGDRLPFGADVFPGLKGNDTVLWLESQRAVISGDTLVDFGRGSRSTRGGFRPGVTPRRSPRGCGRYSHCGRARACDARRADRRGRPRARVVLLLDPLKGR